MGTRRGATVLDSYHQESEDRVSTLNFREVYTNLLNRVRRVSPTEELAAQLTIGGHFEQFGILERELLKLYGLRPDHYVIDIGCGSGRLTHALASYLKGNYLVLMSSPRYSRMPAPEPVSLIGALRSPTS